MHSHVLPFPVGLNLLQADEDICIGGKSVLLLDGTYNMTLYHKCQPLFAKTERSSTHIEWVCHRVERAWLNQNTLRDFGSFERSLERSRD